MRIVHVIDLLDPRRGGPPVIAASLAAAQAALGHEVHLVSYASGGQSEPIVREIPNWEMVQHVRISGYGLLEKLTARRATRHLERVCARADVIHLHRVWERILPVAATIARKHEVPYVVLLNGMLDPWSLQQSRWKKRIALQLGWRQMLERASALQFGNPDERELIRPLELDTPGVILPNGIWPEIANHLPRPGSFRTRHPEIGNNPFILFLGRLHHKKGTDYLVDAFISVAQQCPEVQLVIAGPASTGRKDVERQVAQSGVSDRIHIVGPLYGAEKQAAFVDATCFCLPSRQEGFPVAVLEAVGCGLPSVISANCHFPELAAANAGFVLPLDAGVFAQHLVRLVLEPDLRQEFSRRGRELIASGFTWPTIAQQSIQVYERLMSARGRQLSTGGAGAKLTS